jgi:RNA polymerase sigma-70 factor (ECF subfamily)
LDSDNKRARFETNVSPHVDAAYNLARWLTRNEHDAQDVVQEAMLRAFRFLDGFRGADARSWLLKIVRNTCFTWLRNNRPNEMVEIFPNQLNDLEVDLPPPFCSGLPDDPEALALRRNTAAQIDNALSTLSAPLLEVVVLRELEGLSYKEIASVIDAPIGTVMSRLARARADLRRTLAGSQCVLGARK